MCVRLSGKAFAFGASSIEIKNSKGVITIKTKKADINAFQVIILFLKGCGLDHWSWT